MAAFHIFIDTNVLLAFYAYTKDDLEQLKTVKELIKNNKLVLYMPQQVVDEYHRNREVKLAESIRDFSKSINQTGIPRFMLSFEEANAFQKALKALQVSKAQLISAAQRDAEMGVLAADAILNGLIEASVKIDTTAQIIAAAKTRKLIGNPPGKKDSYGDQINWEALIAAVPQGIDLHIVSKDGDFASALTPAQPHHVLIQEWKKKKNGKLTLHEELRPFLNIGFPGINLATDVEKTTAIERLENSFSFAGTHAAIARLESLFDLLTWSDADRIFTIGLENQQISWIGSDEDVFGLYSKLIDKFLNKLDKPRLDRLNEIFKAAT